MENTTFFDNASVISKFAKGKNMVPYYLENHLKNIRKSKDRVTAILASSAGNTKLDIFITENSS